MREYKYTAPASFEELFILLKDHGDEETRVIAGGTDFIPKLNEELDSVPAGEKKPLHMIYPGKLGLDQIEVKGQTVVIGALCTLNHVKNSAVIKEKFPVLVDTIGEIAGMAVRNTATLGGNIMNASPAADSVPTLIALDAKFVLKGAEGEREIDAKDFFTGPGETKAGKGEILTAVKIEAAGGSAAFVKLGRRKAETLSIANAAVNLVISDGICKKANVAVGSLGPTVIKCRKVEEALSGKKLSAEVIAEAARQVTEEISPIDDIRGSIWYRKKITPVLVERALLKASNL